MMAGSSQLPATQEKDDPRYRPSETVPEVQEDEIKAIEFPDGGIEAWLQVLGSFLCLMNTW